MLSHNYFSILANELEFNENSLSADEIVDSINPIIIPENLKRISLSLSPIYKK